MIVKRYVGEIGVSDGGGGGLEGGGGGAGGGGRWPESAR